MKSWDEVKMGQEVWVRAKVVDMPPPGTLGYANGLITVQAVAGGLNAGSNQRISTDLRNIKAG